MEKEADYPMGPGVELLFLDDSTPDTMTLDVYKSSAGQNLYLYTPKNLSPGEHRVFYYIHGGSYMRGNGPWCKTNAMSLARYLGMPVFATEYRYIPEHPFPAACDDNEAAWNYITQTLGHSPADIILGGESAGGNFIGSLVERLLKKGAALPRCMVFISAAMDFTYSSASYTDNKVRDKTFGEVDFAETEGVYTDKDNLKNTEVSPVFADASKWPPSFYYVDESEVFLSDSLITAEKIHKAGKPVEVYITYGLIHCFMFEAPNIPESAACFKAMKAFIDKV
jgi:acetyl esterase/lipase